jgi:CheY-like chemotaxis protein
MTATTLKEKARIARILLVEDNRGDVILIQRAFKEARIANHIAVAESGEEAMSMLHGEKQAMPDLILLDLNLPRMHGREVLSLIKSDPGLKHIPVVILSSSRTEADVEKSYALHANGYVVKPGNSEEFGSVVEKLEQFWFTLVVLPHTSASRQ